MTEPRQEQRKKRNDGPRTYEHVPVIHRPHWKWLVIWYFFIGGIGAASGIIGAIASLQPTRQRQSVARHAYGIAFLTMLICPVLLILDLGKPTRFLNMLRVLKLRSPMSVGSWALTAFGGVVGLAVAHDSLQGRVGWVPTRSGPVSKALHLAAIPLGAMVAAYTGALLAATAVPLWAKAPRMLTALFVSSAFATGTSAIAASRALFGYGADPSPAIGGLKQFAMLTELVTLIVWLKQLGAAGKPLREGTTGSVVDHGVIGLGLAAPMAIAAATGYRTTRGARWLRFLGLCASLLGGFALRYAVIVGGRASADDPQATFDFTRTER